MKTIFFTIILLVSPVVLLAQTPKTLPQGLIRLEESKTVAFFSTKPDIEKYVALTNQAAGIQLIIDKKLVDLSSCKLDVQLGSIQKNIDSIPKKTGWVGTLVEAQYFSSDSAYCAVNVTRLNKPKGASTTDKVEDKETYYVLTDGLLNGKFFDNSEDISIGILTFPFIYKFSDKSFGSFNSVGAYLKWTRRIYKDKYFSIGPVVGGTIFTKRLDNSDSLAKNPNANLLLGGGITFEAIENKVNLGVMGGWSLGKEPSAWISVVLGIDIANIKK